VFSGYCVSHAICSLNGLIATNVASPSTADLLLLAFASHQSLITSHELLSLSVFCLFSPLSFLVAFLSRLSRFSRRLSAQGGQVLKYNIFGLAEDNPGQALV